jgi:hypothetical protein
MRAVIVAAAVSGGRIFRTAAEDSGSYNALVVSIRGNNGTGFPTRYLSGKGAT